MAGGRLTVRQKMINMMYLVLTALLALNVSAEILRSFHKMEVSMDRAGMNIDKKNENTLAAIAKYRKDIPSDPTGKIVADKTAEAHKISTEGVKYFSDLKNVLIKNAGGREATDQFPLGDPDEQVAQPSNIELHANLMIVKGEGAKVKAKINEIRVKLLAFIPEKDRNLIKSDLIAEDPKGKTKSWESEMFEYTPLAAVVALLSKTENDVKNTESQVLDYLKSSLTAEVMLIDKLVPQIIPTNGTNITVGNKYAADIFLAASSSRQKADIKVNGNPVEVIDGTGKYEVTATREGENKFKAAITTTNSAGKTETIETEGSYFALAPLAVISATKMNIVYIGLENPISVSVPGVAAKDVVVTCSAGGNLRPDTKKGTFLLSVQQNPAIRKVTITATVKSGNSSRVMGFAEYRIRQVPKPTPMLGPIESSGMVSLGMLKSANFVLTPLKDFAFEGVDFKPISWSLVYQPKLGQAQVENGYGTGITPRAKTMMNNARPGDRFILMNIKAQGPAGAVPLPSSLALEVRN